MVILAFSLVGMSGTAAAFGLASAVQFSLASEVLHTAQELCGNPSLGSGANVERMPPVPTFVVNTTFPVGPGGFGVGPEYTRQLIPLGGGQQCVVESFGVALQQNLGPNGMLSLSGAHETLFAPGFTGAGLRGSVGAGFGDRVVIAVNHDIHFFTGGTEVVQITSLRLTIRQSTVSGNRAN